ncbi:putative gamma-glutamylcyclotransferase CG2811 isoform X2 [Athalia rosae]|uniref:putative gamma-glutamylcyclotransferase CG2811 isoform X2 n=1 Tax=Athalia rosae TaxID=37344 RepID=UPI00062506F1|nr:putative gamma-glutamylcyclotransferase CG2811 isoform X2 [Athalia rosae]
MYENLFKSPLNRIFVYGTLKRGEPNHKFIENNNKGYAKFVGIGQTVTKYPLVIATKYNIPFLLKQPNVGHHITGEVYDVDSKTMKYLDELEEHPDFYVRTEDEVRLITDSEYKNEAKFDEVGELIKAWIYFLPKFKHSLLSGPLYSSYSSDGQHGLKYMESENNTARLEDVL